jgi:Protein of unknown function, DUF547
MAGRTPLRSLTLVPLMLALALAFPVASDAQPEFDHTYAVWNGLLRQHVQWLPGGVQTRVDYDGFAADRARLTSALQSMSAVDAAAFARWSRAQQMALLVNAYNAFTVELILTGWPGLASIKDLGSFVRSPWRQPFFTLLGARRHLDWIEHEQLRPRYEEPRLHAALNCASVGCPALSPDAFVATRLEAQLEDSMRRFLGDRTRNRVTGGRLEVSMIFKWYAGDFERGHGGMHGVADLFARYADQLSDDPAVRAALRQHTIAITYLPYDWSLNVLHP